MDLLSAQFGQEVADDRVVWKSSVGVGSDGASVVDDDGTDSPPYNAVRRMSVESAASYSHRARERLSKLGPLGSDAVGCARPGEEQPKKAGAGDDDGRTLAVDWDEQGARLKEWRTAVSESFEEPLVGCDFEGAHISLYMYKVFLREGDNPRQWDRIFFREHGIRSRGRSFHGSHLPYRCDVACW